MDMRPEGGFAHLLVSTAEMAFRRFSAVTGPPARRPSHYSPGTEAPPFWCLTRLILSSRDDVSIKVFMSLLLRRHIFCLLLSFIFED